MSCTAKERIGRAVCYVCLRCRDFVVVALTLYAYVAVVAALLSRRIGPCDEKQCLLYPLEKESPRPLPGVDNLA